MRSRKSATTIKPINVIVFTAAILLMVAGGFIVFGWTTQRRSFVLIGEDAFVVAFVISCLPLIAFGVFQFWRKVKR
jgi:hypothetical protein